jgi:perosamine synthetase
MPMYSGRYQRIPVAEDIARRGINLPSFPSLTDNEVREVCDAVQGFYAAHRALALVA